MRVLDSFGSNGRRLELFRSGGYAQYRFGGDIRGPMGELDCLVGFKLSAMDMDRLVTDALKSGTAVCCAWFPSH